MNVFDATMKRIDFVFNHFGYVYVSFSGGKDSGVLLNMVLQYCKQNGINKNVGVFHIDYEAQYQNTTEYVTQTFNALPDWIDKYWCCMPLTVPCCTSMFSNNWIPWDNQKKNIWVRPMPEGAINIDNHHFDFYRYGIEDYEFQKRFGEWLQREKKCTVACLIGVRSDESMDRRIMIANTTNKRKYKNILWSTGGVSDNKLQYNFYPIYDWNVDDIWIANAKNGWTYNKLYDLYYMAGLNVSQMRVASPFISQGIENLKLYKVIEPNTWGKLVSRVNGVNFSGIYGGTTAMGWKSITKPDHFTWKQYAEFLLTTLPADVRRGYEAKLATSIKFWTERGGVVDDDVATDLQNSGADCEILDENPSYKTDKKTAKFSNYPDDLGISEFRAVPSYKRLCVCILKNDHLCKYMGFTLTKEEVTRRKNIIDKYHSLL